MAKLTCDMTDECRSVVTHIGSKGYVYCAEHARERRGWESARKMRKWEIERLESGEPLQSYKPVPRYA